MTDSANIEASNATKIAVLASRMDSMEKWTADLDTKLDKLLAAAAMGQGAWWVILKIGGLIVGVVAIVAAASTIYKNFTTH